ncbi:DUF1758 domain-containing protein, partial [Nephila pilipes]
MLVNFVLSKKESIFTEMRRFWELESSGIRGDEIDSGMKDKEGLRVYNESVQLVENRYCVKLPWKEGMQEKLGNNWEVVLRGIKGLVERFKRDPVLYNEYREVVDGYFEEGIVEFCMTE